MNNKRFWRKFINHTQKHISGYLLFLLILSASLLIYKNVFADKVHKNVKREVIYVEYTVMPGDTLWSISKEFEYEGDIRDFIDRIRTINGTSALIMPGQTLKIPTFGDEK